jgi:ribonuclease P/MRP protein subunit RPP1
LRRFIDLHLKPPEGAVSLEAMLELASRLEFEGVGVDARRTSSQTDGRSASAHGLDVVGRVDLTPKDSRELTTLLRRLRRRYEVIAVECHSKSVARQAAKDNRVDVLNFPNSALARKRVWFDRQEASLASDANSAYEINISTLYDHGPISAGKLLTIMRNEVENAMRYDVPIVVSSGARDPLLMRGPRELASILDLLGIGEEEGLDAVSGTPWDIVERNRIKLGTSFVAPGVRVA